jgi:hypothetical protein
MWSNFYAAGGWGMYPVSVFGFFLIATSVLYALRPQPRLARLAFTLGAVTFAAGVLGAITGMCTCFHYIPQVEQGKQLAIMALGVEESLHDTVLALMLVVLGGLITAIGTTRAANVPASS